MTKKLNLVQSANGLLGCLIYTGNGDYLVRVYDKVKMSMFKDYKIRLSDLMFTITDEDAYLYEDPETGNHVIDYSPTTLGIATDTVE